ncbi:MAG: hypothetical protein WAU65_02590 [Candidatus Nanoarchaeia archaeon]
MSLHDLLSKILGNNDGILINVKGSNDISIFVKEGGSYEPILTISPKDKTAEFVNIEEDWTEIQSALEKKHENYPELRALADYLTQEEYNITW